MNTNNMTNNIVIEEDECDMCPICIEVKLDTSNTTTIYGCGHGLCCDCYNVLKENFSTNDNEGLGIQLIKCPMCRGIEKPSPETLKEKIHNLHNIVKRQKNEIKKSTERYEKLTSGMVLLFEKDDNEEVALFEKVKILKENIEKKREKREEADRVKKSKILEHRVSLYKQKVQLENELEELIFTTLNITSKKANENKKTKLITKLTKIITKINTL